MVLFLFSLIGIPLTAGFWAKWQVIFGVLDLPANADSLSVMWFVVLAVITAVNAAIGGWYYLRIAAVMYLRTPLRPAERPRFSPALAAVWLCAWRRWRSASTRGRCSSGCRRRCRPRRPRLRRGRGRSRRRRRRGVEAAWPCPPTP